MSVKIFYYYLAILIGVFGFIGLLHLPLQVLSLNNLTEPEIIAIQELDPSLQFDATRVLVSYKTLPPASKTEIKTLAKQDNGSTLVFVEINDITELCAEPYIAQSDADRLAVEDKIAELMSDPTVEYAEPNYIKTASAWTVGASDATPGDYNAINHWYYDQAHLPELWYQQGCDGGLGCGGDSAVTVAVIDTGVAFESYDDTGADGFSFLGFGISGGVDYTAVSSDLSGINLYTNSSEIANNGKDDDCNGYVDDYNGVDTFATYVLLQGAGSDITCPGGTPRDFSGSEYLYVRKMGHPVDTHGHGTVVSGTIVGNLDNETNTAGTVSPNSNISLMPISANLHYSGFFFTSDILDGITYAAENGADIINMSLGASQSSNVEKAFYKQLFLDYPDLIITAASGNDGVGSVDYPAAYEGVLAVGAADSDNTLSSYSSYGNEVDLVAYVGSGNSAGAAVYQKTLSCYPSCDETSSYNTITEKYTIGTSFAAPQVAAAAAILKSDDNAMTGDDIKLALLSKTTDILDSGSDIYSGNGVLDYDALLTEADVVFTKEYYFPAYAHNESNFRAYIKVSNPSAVDSAQVAVYFENVFHHFDTLAPGARMSISKNVSGVSVMVTSDNPVIVTQKAFDGQGFNEIQAVELADLDTDYYFPAYANNGANLKGYIKIGNPISNSAATVTVKMNGNLEGTYNLDPGERVSHSSNLMGVSVEVNSDQPVFVTQKAFEGNGYNEMFGIKASEITNNYFFPAYAHNGNTLRSYIKVANPEGNPTAAVTIKMNGSTVGSYNLAGGERISHNSNLTGVNVEVISDQNVFVTQKSFDQQGMNELKGIKSSDLTTNYFFPAYAHNGSNLKAYIKVANPEGNPTAAVTIKMNGSTVGSYNLAAGERISHSSNLIGATVEVISDQNVIVTQKAFEDNGYNEMKGVAL